MADSEHCPVDMAKGGDGERFIEVRAAYEQLTTRRAYWETVGARQSGDGDDAGGTYSQAWEQAKLRVRLKFEGGELVMPAEEYLRADSADASDVLRQAFDGKKVSFKILNADGQEVMSGERDAVVKRRERLPSSGEEGASSSAIVGDIGESDGGDANSPADSPPLPPAWAAQAVQLTLGLDAAELEELLEAVRELRTQGSGSDADSSGGAGALASALTSSRDVWALLAARVDAARVAGLLAASAAFVAAALFTFT